MLFSGFLLVASVLSLWSSNVFLKLHDEILGLHDQNVRETFYHDEEKGFVVQMSGGLC